MSSLESISSDPAVVGLVHCNEEGDILHQEGDEGDVLAHVLVYFQQVAALIGDSFGMEDFGEAHIQGQSVTIIHRPVEDGVVGVIVNNRARVNTVSKLMVEALS